MRSITRILAEALSCRRPMRVARQRALSTTGVDGALALPALSTAFTAYAYCTPAGTVSLKNGSWIGDGVIGSSGAPGRLAPRITMYPARSRSVLGSQIRLIAPSLGIAVNPFGTAGGNVSVSVSHGAAAGSLSTVSPPTVSAVRTT